MLNDSAITLSPRLSSGYTEPTYSSEVDASLSATPNAANSIPKGKGGQMNFAVICRNCTSWSSPPLDLNSVAAPFMFAFGPVNDASYDNRWSDSLTNQLRIHVIQGTFNMNMKLATTPFGKELTVPNLRNETYGATIEHIRIYPGDYATTTHAIAMALACLLIFPLDIALRNWVRLVWVHVVAQILVALLLITGLLFGCWTAIEYIRVSHAK
jgi:hypothetical protein